MITTDLIVDNTVRADTVVPQMMMSYATPMMVQMMPTYGHPPAPDPSYPHPKAPMMMPMHKPMMQPMPVIIYSHPPPAPKKAMKKDDPASKFLTRCIPFDILIYSFITLSKEISSPHIKLIIYKNIPVHKRC